MKRVPYVLAAALLWGCPPTQVTPDAGEDTGADADAGPEDATPDVQPDAPPDVQPDADAGAPEIKILNLTPARGPTSGGTTVTVKGAGFVKPFATYGGPQVALRTKVTFAGNLAIDVAVIDDDTIEVRTPTGLSGAAELKIENPNGTATCSGCFIYFEPIELRQVAPTSGPLAGGEALVLTGKGFTAGTTVLLGGRAATVTAVSEAGDRIDALTPQGTQAGSVDVTVLNEDAIAFLRRGYTYFAPVALDAVQPPTGPLAGGVEAVLTGSGFVIGTEVTFGTTSATVLSVADGEAHVRVPASPQAGPVDVTVKNRFGQSTLTAAFAYFDPEDRGIALYTVAPRRGPTTGSVCNAAGALCISLTGVGLSATDLEVRIGSVKTGIARVHSDNWIETHLPPNPAGPADVQVRSSRGGAMLAGVFTYVLPLRVDSISPGVAPANGTPATPVTVTGVGFDAQTSLFVGALPATDVLAAGNGGTLTATAPSGAPGPADVVARRLDADGSVTEARLSGAFEFTAPLDLQRVDPATGAQAGGTRVRLYGTGFRTGVQVTFGGAVTEILSVDSPHQITVKTPPGNAGPVDVTVATDLESDTLAAGFSYTDPMNSLGGASGGPLAGTLNVTVLGVIGNTTVPVEKSHVFVGSSLDAYTDARGQVTFSDPSLIKPQNVTATCTVNDTCPLAVEMDADFESLTVLRHNAENLTVFIFPTAGGPPSPPQPGPPPAQVSGRVIGFKLPPGVTLGEAERMEARVFVAVSNIYSAPPYRAPARPIVVLQDGATFQMFTRYGGIALYAIFGVNNLGVDPPVFTPYLMGIRRGIEASPDVPVTDADIILDVHLDQTIPVNVDPPLSLPGALVAYLPFSYMDLGSDGVIPLGFDVSLDPVFELHHHPRLPGDGFIFLNVAAPVNFMTGDLDMPYSFYYRRQLGDLAAGLSFGPMLPLTNVVDPADGGRFSGTIRWEVPGADGPDIDWLFVSESGFIPIPVWQVILPGTELSAVVPEAVRDTMKSGVVYEYFLLTARSPRFDFDHWGYQQLGLNSWTAFTQDAGYFVQP